MILIDLKENIHDKAFKRFVIKHYHYILAEMLTDKLIETTKRNGLELYFFPSS
ncbi:MAG: hypothetical protein ACFFAV_02705 [Candidatus Hermodarchaeota archaeon]